MDDYDKITEELVKEADKDKPKDDKSNAETEIEIIMEEYDKKLEEEF